MVVGPREALDVTSLVGERPFWAGPAPVAGAAVGVQVRAHGEEVPGTVVSVDGAGVRVALERPLRGVASGQTLALYAGTRVVGSATITSAR